MLSHLDTPDFERAAADTFKSVEVALCAFHLYSEQTHFHVAMRAEKQRLDGWWFRKPVVLCKRAGLPHGMYLSWLVTWLRITLIPIVGMTTI